jgi:hypothetical protein
MMKMYSSGQADGGRLLRRNWDLEKKSSEFFSFLFTVIVRDGHRSYTFINPKLSKIIGSMNLSVYHIQIYQFAKISAPSMLRFYFLMKLSLLDFVAR